MKSLLLAFAAIAAPADAGPPHVTDRGTRQVFEEYTKCAARQRPKDAAAVVLSTIATDKILKQHPSLVTPDCLDAGQLRMPGADFLRYGLAEELVRREFADGLPADIAQAGPIPHLELDEAEYRPKPGKRATAKQLADFEKRRREALATRIMSLYGECVVRADPHAALRLLLSKSASSAEAASFAAMKDALSSCLPEGETITLDKTSLRGTIAMNLYRLAHAPRVRAALTRQ